MAVTEIKSTRLSDLVLFENEPYVGRSRRVVQVETADDLEMGVVVYRAKDSLDLDTPYKPVTDADLVATNEFAVVFGDKFACKTTVEADASGTTPAIAFVGFDVVLKDEMLLKVNGFDRDSDEHKALQALLERQDVILAETMVPVTQ